MAYHRYDRKINTRDYKTARKCVQCGLELRYAKGHTTRPIYIKGDRVYFESPDCDMSLLPDKDKRFVLFKIIAQEFKIELKQLLHSSTGKRATAFTDRMNARIMAVYLLVKMGMNDSQAVKALGYAGGCQQLSRRVTLIPNYREVEQRIARKYIELID